MSRAGTAGSGGIRRLRGGTAARSGKSSERRGDRGRGENPDPRPAAARGRTRRQSVLARALPPRPEALVTSSQPCGAMAMSRRIARQPGRAVIAPRQFPAYPAQRPVIPPADSGPAPPGQALAPGIRPRQGPRGSCGYRRNRLASNGRCGSRDERQARAPPG